jgi:hypothetical protein
LSAENDALRKKLMEELAGMDKMGKGELSMAEIVDKIRMDEVTRAFTEEELRKISTPDTPWWEEKHFVDQRKLAARGDVLKEKWGLLALNGGMRKEYAWAQDASEVVVSVEVPEGETCHGAYVVSPRLGAFSYY